MALSACAWFALSARQAITTSQATNLLSAHAIAVRSQLSSAEARRASSTLADAEFLNPDSTVDLLDAQLEAELAERAAATRTALAVARREPMNLAAWYEVGHAAADVHTALLAESRIASLLGRLDH